MYTFVCMNVALTGTVYSLQHLVQINTTLTMVRFYHAPPSSSPCLAIITMAATMSFPIHQPNVDHGQRRESPVGVHGKTPCFIDTMYSNT